MSTFLTAAIAVAGVNSLLLVALCSVWVRNYRTFKTGLTLGLLAFGVVLLVENLAAVYFFVTMGMGGLYADTPVVGEVVFLLRGLQFLALAFLTYVTLK